MSNFEELDALVDVTDMGRRGVHPSFGEVTVSQLLAPWVVHYLNHLGHSPYDARGTRDWEGEIARRIVLDACRVSLFFAARFSRP
jgi:hypothetical protein